MERELEEEFRIQKARQCGLPYNKYKDIIQSYKLDKTRKELLNIKPVDEESLRNIIIKIIKYYMRYNYRSADALILLKTEPIFEIEPRRIYDRYRCTTLWNILKRADL